MCIMKRLSKLEEEFMIVDRPIVKIYQKDGTVMLNDDDPAIPIEKYKQMIASGEISEDRKEILVRKVVLRNDFIIKCGR